MSLGERLKNLRLARELSQRELAQTLRVGASTIASYELGRREPDRKALATFAQFFDVSTDYLIGLVDDPKPSRPKRIPPAISDEKMQAAFALVMEWPPAKKLELLSYISFLNGRPE